MERYDMAEEFGVGCFPDAPVKKPVSPTNLRLMAEFGVRRAEDLERCIALSKDYGAAIGNGARYDTPKKLTPKRAETGYSISDLAMKGGELIIYLSTNQNNPVQSVASAYLGDLEDMLAKISTGISKKAFVLRFTKDGRMDGYLTITPKKKTDFEEEAAILHAWKTAVLSKEVIKEEGNDVFAGKRF